MFFPTCHRALLSLTAAYKQAPGRKKEEEESCYSIDLSLPLHCIFTREREIDFIPFCSLLARKGTASIGERKGSFFTQDRGGEGGVASRTAHAAFGFLSPS